MFLETGHPPKHMVAQCDHRYVGHYNWCTELGGWILIVGVSDIDNSWKFHEVDQNTGEPFGQPQDTTILLWSNRFAVYPFNVNEAEPESEFDWFSRMCASKDAEQVRRKYQVWKRHMRQSECAFDALISVGAIADPYSNKGEHHGAAVTQSA